MTKPEIPLNDDLRLKSLYSHDLLDTLPEEEYDDIAAIAQGICKTPIALISLVDKDRQWFKSVIGLSVKETTRDSSFCAHAINIPSEILQIRDTLNDDRFKDNPLVLEDPNIRFYAGAPILDENGYALGTLCVIDQEPRELTPNQLKSLRSLANSVQKILAFRKVFIQLNHTKQLYEDLLSNVTDFIYEVDGAGKFIYVNEAFLNALGYDFEMLKKMNYYDLIHEDDRNEFIASMKQKVRNKDQEAFAEVRIRCKTGEIKWVGLTAKLLYQNKKFIKIWAVARDITENKNVETELKEQEAKYRLLSDNISDLICLHDTLGVFTFISPSVTRLLGYSAEELLGKNSFDIMHPEDIERIKNGSHNEALKGEEVASDIYRLRRKDGEYIWAETYTTPLYDEKRQVTGLQTATRDISKLISQQEALEKSKEQSEAAVIEKSKFLSTMSHEIRTPLNAIIGIGHILSEDGPLPNQIEYLNMLKFSGKNLMNIINNVLDFSKIEDGKIVLENQPMNIEEVVFGLFSSLEVQAKEKKIDLKMEFDPNIPSSVLGDQMRLIQVLNNLISNAIKFAGDSDVLLRVKIKSKLKEQVEILFEVEDGGIGIPIDKQNLIFDRFVQASENTTRKYGGSGLGLSISNKLIGLMGSKIEVKSVEGIGSTFYFSIYFPICTSEDQYNQTKSKKPNLASHNIRILLAEDNEINSLIAQRTLEKFGIQVNTAENGLVALDMAKKGKYDMILMDLQMPVMDGYEASVRIKKLDDYKDIPILALTASSTIQENVNVSDMGTLDGLITKPYRSEDLYNNIVSFLKIEKVKLR